MDRTHARAIGVIRDFGLSDSAGSWMEQSYLFRGSMHARLYCTAVSSLNDEAGHTQWGESMGPYDHHSRPMTTRKIPRVAF